MIFETVKSEGLAHFSYLFGDDQAGVCAVIDPRRDVQVYLDLAQKHDANISFILETHIHADFVSGSRELASRTGAPICVGAEAEQPYGFEHRPLKEGQVLELGEFSLEVLHTPGHTREHICFLVSGGAGAQAHWGLFSGDTLFAGEVGRPDIPEDVADEELARQLYHSLHDKILPLGDGIALYPAHGEGSPCGASIGARQTSTIGYEREQNKLLQVADIERFVEQLLAALPPVPSYYPRMKELNARGPKVLGASAFLPSLDPEQFAEEMERENTVVLDAREIVAFGGGFIPDSVNVGLREPFPIWAGRILDETLPIWAGWIVPPDSRLLLVTASAEEAEQARIELQRVGYDNIVGYLRKGFHAWADAGQSFASLGLLSVHELNERLEAQDSLQVVDVRSRQEWEQGHVPGALHIHVPEIEEKADRLDKETPVVTYCGSGYRASIAASLLARQGFEQVANVPGSITAWKEAGYPLEEPVASPRRTTT